jgi:hypothetical protein
VYYLLFYGMTEILSKVALNATNQPKTNGILSLCWSTKFLFKLKVKVLLENVESDSAKRSIYIAAKNNPINI